MTLLVLKLEQQMEHKISEALKLASTYILQFFSLWQFCITKYFTSFCRVQLGIIRNLQEFKKKYYILYYLYNLNVKVLFSHHQTYLYTGQLTILIHKNINISRVHMHTVYVFCRLSYQIISLSFIIHIGLLSSIKHVCLTKLCDRWIKPYGFCKRKN